MLNKQAPKCVFIPLTSLLADNVGSSKRNLISPRRHMPHGQNLSSVLLSDVLSNRCLFLTALLIGTAAKTSIFVFFNF